MAIIRFATAQALLDAFPELENRISVRPADELPVEFVLKLTAQGKLGDAISFGAYLLPRRETVWWGCRCIRKLSDGLHKTNGKGLTLAEEWVFEPNDERRLSALE